MNRNKIENKILNKRYINEGQVTLKFLLLPFSGDNIRIWKSTYLIPDNSDKICKLIDVYNISLYPEWTKIDMYKINNFTLVFEALPKGCKSFSLLEEGLGEGCFDIKNISRNKTDLYNLPLA